MTIEIPWIAIKLVQLAAGIIVLAFSAFGMVMTWIILRMPDNEN